MKKLSKAQERELERIRFNYTPEKIEGGKQYYIEHIANAENEKWKEWYQEHLEMYEKGFILWESRNSRTLEILAEAEMIDYIKVDTNRRIPIDWVRLKGEA